MSTLHRDVRASGSFKARPPAVILSLSSWFSKIRFQEKDLPRRHIRISGFTGLFLLDISHAHVPRADFPTRRHAAHTDNAQGNLLKLLKKSGAMHVSASTVFKNIIKVETLFLINARYAYNTIR
ncbi:MAG: hypothetical protein ACYDBT_12100 [Desulfobulbaceae bacterium]